MLWPEPYVERVGLTITLWMFFYYMFTLYDHISTQNPLEQDALRVLTMVVLLLFFPLTHFHPAITFCPSVPPQDSSLCCPRALSEGGRKKLEGWRGGIGQGVGLHYVFFPLQLGMGFRGWEGLDYHISASWNSWENVWRVCLQVCLLFF